MRVLVTLSLLLLATGVVAQDDDEPGWSGKGEFGLVSARGNTEAETINMGLHFVYNLEQWRHSADLVALRSEDEGETSAERYELSGKSDYKLSDISYAFGSLRYLSDQFSEFETQTTVAAGYGRELLDGEVHDLDGEIGLGYRRSELRFEDETEGEAIIRAALNYKWIISDTSSLTNDLLIEAGSDNTFGQNTTALNTRINGALGLQVAYDVRHNTDASDPTENSDFLTTVSLVYDFN